MMDTWGGLMETIRSYWSEFLRLVAESGTWDALKSQLKELTDYLDNAFATGQLKDWAETISSVLVPALNTLFDVIKTVWNIIREIWNLFAAVPEGVIDFFMRLEKQANLSAQAISGNSLALMELDAQAQASQSNTMQVLEALNTWSANTLSTLQFMSQSFGEIIAYLITIFVNAVKSMWDAWSAFVNGLINLTSNIVQAFSKDFGGLVDIAVAAGRGIWSAMKEVADNIGAAFHAVGGIIKGALEADVGAIEAAWGNLKSAITAPIGEGAKAEFKAVIEGVAASAQESVSKIVNAGKEMGAGLSKAWTDYEKSANTALNNAGTALQVYYSEWRKDLLNIPDLVEPSIKATEKLSGTHKKISKDLETTGESAKKMGDKLDEAAKKGKKLNDLDYGEITKQFDSLRKQIESMNAAFDDMAYAAGNAGAGFDKGMSDIARKGDEAIQKWMSDLISLSSSLTSMQQKIASATGVVDPKVIEYFNQYKTAIEDLNNKTGEYIENVKKWVALEQERLKLQREVEVDRLALDYSKLVGTLKDQLLVENQLLEAQQKLIEADPAKAHLVSISRAVTAQKEWLNEMRATGSVVDGIKYGFQEMGREASTAFDQGIEAAKDAAREMESAFDRFFDQMIENPKNIVDAFQEMATDILRTIVALAAKALLYPIVIPIVQQVSTSILGGGASAAAGGVLGGIGVGNIFGGIRSGVNWLGGQGSGAIGGNFGMAGIGTTAPVSGGWMDTLGTIGTRIGDWLRAPVWTGGPTWGGFVGLGGGGALSLGMGISGLLSGGNWANYMGSSLEILGGASMFASLAGLGSILGPIGAGIGFLGGLIGNLFGGSEPPDPQNKVWYGSSGKGKYGITVNPNEVENEAEMSRQITDFLNVMVGRIGNMFNLNMKKVLSTHKWHHTYDLEEDTDFKEYVTTMADDFIKHYASTLADSIVPHTGKLITGDFLSSVKQEGELLADTFIRVMAVMESIPNSARRMRELVNAGASTSEAFEQIQAEAQAIIQGIYSAVQTSLGTVISGGGGAGDFKAFSQNFMMQISASLVSSLDEAGIGKLTESLMETLFEPMSELNTLASEYMSGDIGFEEYKDQTSKLLDQIKSGVKGTAKEFRQIMRARDEMVKEIEDALGITKQRKLAFEEGMKAMVKDLTMTDYQKAMRDLKQWFKGQMSLAKELGADTSLIIRAYNLQLEQINEQYNKPTAGKVSDDVLPGTKEWKLARNAFLDALNETIHGAVDTDLKAKVSELKDWYSEQIKAAVEFDIPKAKIDEAFRLLLDNLIEEFLGTSKEAIDTSGMTDLGKQLHDLTTVFDEMTKSLKQSGLSGEDLEKALNLVTQAYKLQRQELVEGFLKPFQDVITTNGMTDLGKQLRTLDEEFRENIDTAKELGKGINLVTQAYKIQKRELISSFKAPLQTTVETSGLSDLGKQLDALHKEFLANRNAARELGLGLGLVTKAYQVQREEIIENFLKPFQDEIATSGMTDFGKQLHDLHEQFLENRRAALDAGKGIEAVTQAYWLSVKELRQAFKEPLKTTVDTAWMNSYERSIYDLTREYRTNMQAARELGLSVDLVTKAYQAQIAVLQYQFLGELRSAVIGLLPAFQQSLINLRIQVEEWRRTARALGIDIMLVNQVYRLLKADIIAEQKAQVAAEREAAAQAEAEAIRQAAEEAERLQEAIQNAAEQVASAWKNLADSIEDQINDMRFSLDNPATAQQRMALIQAEIDALTGGRTGTDLERYLASMPQDQAQETVAQLQQLYGELLAVGQEAYQRPATEYQALYSDVLSALTTLEGFARTRDDVQEVMAQHLYDISDYQSSISNYSSQTADYTSQTADNTQEILDLLDEIEKQMNETKTKASLKLTQVERETLSKQIPNIQKMTKHIVDMDSYMKPVPTSIKHVENATTKSLNRLISIDKTLLSIEEKLAPEKSAKGTGKESLALNATTNNKVDIDMANKFIINEAFNAKKTASAIQDWWNTKGLKLVDKRIRQAIAK
jgi:hypothetical protein